jgi:hypothetical protein
MPLLTLRQNFPRLNCRKRTRKSRRRSRRQSRRTRSRLSRKSSEKERKTFQRRIKPVSGSGGSGDPSPDSDDYLAWKLKKLNGR